MNEQFWKGKKILVTGGAGFIGSHVTERLVELGATVRAVDNLERGKLENIRSTINQIEFFERDLREKYACEEVCRSMDVVIHLASKVGGIKYYLQKPGQLILQNAQIDSFMLQASLQHGVDRYLYASSAHVYPIDRQLSPDASPLVEEDSVPAHPDLSYGWAKLLGEKQIEYSIAEGTKLKAAIVRLVGVYGENQELDLETGSAIPVFMRRAIEYPDHGPFVIWGTGEETRSYCYIDDVVEGLLRAVENLNTHQLLGPLNLGNEGRIRMGELAERIVQISGKEIEIIRDTSKPTLIWGQAVSCAKARKVLGGWEPRVSLDEGLRKTYGHLAKRLAKQQVGLG